MKDFASRFASLPRQVQALIERLISAARTDERDTFASDHWLMTKELHALFGLKLAMYHVLTKSPVNKKVFEHILVETCADTGISAGIAGSGTATIDAVIKSKKTSLKTEGEIHDNVHISKFCELGWGSWSNGKDLYYKIHKRGVADNNRTFEARIDTYDKILMLRHDTSEVGCIKYELLDIPLAVFKRILEIPLDDYERGWKESKSRVAAKSFRVRIPWNKKSNAREIVVLFDGGTECKLTITLPKESAIVAATWSFKLNV